ncbi:sulfatase [Burkholderia cepacia]|uniref:sulfatase family protein n=1 Tax=Burkholderia cepacia TaxID=292 RepID=UPI0009BF0701|nr:sulfatase [Burkholderia cepacia]
MPSSRRGFLKHAVASTALLCADRAAHAAQQEHCTAPTNNEQQRQLLNLVMVFPDEMRAHAQQFMGMDPAHTPRIDRFARESCVMRQAVSNYPLCTPARGMIMSGQYPIHNGMTGNCHDYGALVGIDLSSRTACWSDVLRAQGYALGYVGKWHLDAPRAPYVQSYNNPVHGTKWNEWTPPERRHGFDFWHAYGTYDMHMSPMYWTNQSDRDHPIHVAQWGPIYEADVAIQYLRNDRRKYRDPVKPFALVVSMNPPHSPYDQVPKKYLDLYDGMNSRTLNIRSTVNWDKKYEAGYGPEYMKSYLAMVSGVDEQFGRILDEIDAQGLRNNTLVVFFSDHGCCMGAHGEPTKNNYFEESLRIPMMFRLPGVIAPRSDDLLMSLPDLYPTVLGLLGLSDKTPITVEGADWSVRVKTGKGNGATSQLYFSIPYGGSAYGKRGIRTEQYTLSIERKDKEMLRYVLYDNLLDPFQENNIAESNPALIAELVKHELEPWLEYTGDPWRPQPFDSEAGSTNHFAFEIKRENPRLAGDSPPKRSPL